ncbi:unnamed protein product [Aphanomyces euteiches]|uniref:Pentacotripeptide-repeat region of PRORP domain-containing protein n=1 Tax=Aphanomyces euteiches TaxID=100861 RepID=A0A6G0X9S1_9STRA|nr:hypothetical protein Ae201684_006993 [Aphanomyces euteiches]KAH9087081.1 hypothetical protein Ae201684P_000493 [Aphanomyces euteiches]KAH9133379.1 hypothetical protein AeRB84_020514 [Aphanomyces euteiches]
MKRSAKASARLLQEQLRARSARVSQEEFSGLLAETGRAINSSAAEELLQLVKKQGDFQPTIFHKNAVLHALTRDGRHANVLSTLRKMDRKRESDAVSYNIALASCGWQGDLTNAQHFINRMYFRKLTRCNVTYTHAIQACVRSGNHLQAKVFWDAMIEEGVTPTANTVNAMLSVYLNAQPLTDREKYRSMTQIFDYAIEVRRIQPLRETALLILRVIFPDKIVPFLQSLQDRHLDVALDWEIYKAAMMHANQSGKHHKIVLDILQLYMELRPTIDSTHVQPLLVKLFLSPRSTKEVVDVVWRRFCNSNDVLLFDTLLDQLAKAHLLQDVVELLNKMQRGLSPRSYRIALTLAVSMKDTAAEQRILELFSKRKVPKLNQNRRAFRFHCNVALDYMVNCGHVKAAHLYFDHMPVVHDQLAYGLLFRGYAQLDRPVASQRAIVLELLERMRSADLEPKTGTLCSVVKSLRHQPKLLMGFMRNLANMYPLDLDVYQCAMEVFRKEGMWREAIELCELMNSMGVAPNEKTNAKVLMACANGGEFKTAMEFIEHHVHDGLQQPNIRIFNAAIQVCAKTGHNDMAETLFEGLKAVGLSPTKKTFAWYMNALVNGGQLDKARQLINEMKEHNIPLDIAMYNRLLNGCMGTPSIAFEVLEELKDQHITPEVRTYNQVLGSMISSREVGLEAMESVLDELQQQNLTPTVGAFSMMMAKCLQMGKPQSAMKVWERMIHVEGIWPDTYCFSLYVQAWRRSLRRRPTEKHDVDDDAPSLQVVVEYLMDPKWKAQLQDERLYLEVFKLFVVLLERRNINLADDAHDLLVQMDANALDIVDATAVVMRLFNQENRPDEVAALYHRLQERRLKPSLSCYMEYLIALEAAERWIDSTNVFLEIRRTFGSALTVDKLSRTYMGRQYLRSNSINFKK